MNKCICGFFGSCSGGFKPRLLAPKNWQQAGLTGLYTERQVYLPAGLMRQNAGLDVGGYGRVKHSPNLEFIPVSNAAQISAVESLARTIWCEYYPRIIGQAQVDYMLARFQSSTAIAAQMRDGYEYFLLQYLDRYVGYAAVRVDTDRLFISKLYLLDALRGRGMGRASLLHLAQLAHDRGLRTLWLTVNKYNPALQAYLKIGFVKTAEVVADIGGGYVMDDFQLEWTPADPHVEHPYSGSIQ